MKQRFQAQPIDKSGRMIVRLPEEVSTALPSRGMVTVELRYREQSFTVPLEPDGKGGHWFEVSGELLKIGLTAGASELLEISPLEQWPEPQLPEDIRHGLAEAGLNEQWSSLTNKAKWEWLRWIRSTRNVLTRAKRIRVACSKLEKGDRRPCCFNASSCTVADLAKSGVLMD